jgi:hypothetical protein
MHACSGPLATIAIPDPAFAGKAVQRLAYVGVLMLGTLAVASGLAL